MKVWNCLVLQEEAGSPPNRYDGIRAERQWQAQLIAFLMDGGLGNAPDWQPLDSCVSLAKMYVEAVEAASGSREVASSPKHGIYNLVANQRWQYLSELPAGASALECLHNHFDKPVCPLSFKFLMGTLDQANDDCHYFHCQQNGAMYCVVVPPELPSCPDGLHGLHGYIFRDQLLVS